MSMLFTNVRSRRGANQPTAPRDAERGERYFHLIDPDGHEPLAGSRPTSMMITGRLLLSLY
jgi:hypothetical protein